MIAKTNLTLPSIKLTDAQKKAYDYRAMKLLADHYISKADGYFATSDFARLRNLASNKVVEDDYKTMLKKYNFDKLNKKKAQGYIKSMPLVSSIIRLLKGEKRISPLNFHTKSNNQDVENRFLTSQNDKLVSLIDKLAVNALNAAGIDTGMDDQQTEPVEDAVKKHKIKYQDARAIAGQELLDGIIEEKDIKEKFFGSYKDWIDLGHAYSLKSVVKDDLIYQSIPPEQCYVEYSSNSPYAEDGQAAVITQDWAIVDVVREFGEELAKITIGAADQKKTNALTWLSTLVGLDGNGDPRPKHMLKDETFESAKDFYSKVTNSHNYGFDQHTIQVHRAMMNMLTPVKIVTYIDELGQEQRKEVLDSYTLDVNAGDIDIERLWVNDPWEVVKIGGDTTDSSYSIYPIIRQINPQRADLNNSSTGKLPVNGRRDGLSIPRVLEDFQYKYNLVHLIEERTLSKDGGQPVIIPLSMIPTDPTWGANSLERAETMMYYRDTFNLIIVDDAKMRPDLAQMIKSVNMSTLDSMEKFIKLKEQIKADAWDAIGVNRQRQGETYASDGKATTEQALIRSSIMTADFNVAFNKYEGKELLGLIDYSKFAYINGKTFTKYPSHSDIFVSDATKAIFKLDVEEHCETAYGVSVSVAHLDNDKLNTAKTLAQPLLQNGATAHMAYKAITSTNPTKVEDYLSMAYEIQVDHEAKVNEQQQSSNEKIAGDNLAAVQGELENRMAIAELNAEVARYKVDIDMYLKSAQEGSDDAAGYKAAAEQRGLDIDQQQINLNARKINNDFQLGKEANKIAAKNKVATK